MFRPVSRYAERQLESFLYEREEDRDLFLNPPGEEGLVPLSGINARIYRLPLTVFIGGIAAVILELAEPRVRHGVWDHSIFPTDPVRRLKRTGLAAMVTFYGARSTALRMIKGVTRKHAEVSGATDRGVPYHATDPELLTWVQATAAFGFIGAYDAYAEKLSGDEWNRALREAMVPAKAYGVPEPPASREALIALIERHAPDLEPSETLQTFLAMMRKAEALPPPARPLQPLLVKAAVALVPENIRTRIGIDGEGLRPGEGAAVKAMARSARLLRLRNHPFHLAEQRLAASAASLSRDREP